MTHPIQPLIVDEHGTVRFKPNAIVEHLLDNGGIDMNQIAWPDPQLCGEHGHHLVLGVQAAFREDRLSAHSGQSAPCPAGHRGMPALPDMPGVSVGSPITDNFGVAAADGRLGYSMFWGQMWNAPNLNPWVNIVN